MTKAKDTDSSSSADSKSLGETTDVLNMVMVFLFMYLAISLNFSSSSICMYVCTSYAVTCIEFFLFWFHFVIFKSGLLRYRIHAIKLIPTLTL